MSLTERSSKDAGASGEPYDLLNEARSLRERLASDPALVARARQLGTFTILGRVLLALSDCGFYEYLRANPRFREGDAIARLRLVPAVFGALVSYLVGLQYLERDADGFLRVTPTGEDVFNVYTRGVVNMYIAAYAPIFENLGAALTGAVPLGDPSLARSPVHTSSGTSYLTCGFTIPAVLEILERRNCRHILDLGCGSGDFLVQVLRLWPQAQGVGLDMAPEPLERARFLANAFGVGDRATFHCAAVGRDKLALSDDVLATVEVVTAMYMLHEFGRDGREAVIDVVRALRAALPGRLLVALEVEGGDPTALAHSADGHKGKLDYWLIHALSGQGLPRGVHDWIDLFEAAGCSMESEPTKTGGSYIYQVRL
ncbi:MAG TPA: class I SAM-dependent methyltransferase [Labilithrix sp.]|nr:class I SAM-dependent methyltransferase [Labilithrix sp.]